MIQMLILSEIGTEETNNAEGSVIIGAVMRQAGPKPSDA